MEVVEKDADDDVRLPDANFLAWQKKIVPRQHLSYKAFRTALDSSGEMAWVLGAIYLRESDLQKGLLKPYSARTHKLVDGWLPTTPLTFEIQRALCGAAPRRLAFSAMERATMQTLYRHSELRESTAPRYRSVFDTAPHANNIKDYFAPTTIIESDATMTTRPPPQQQILVMNAADAATKLRKTLALMEAGNNGTELFNRAQSLVSFLARVRAIDEEQARTLYARIGNLYAR